LPTRAVGSVTRSRSGLTTTRVTLGTRAEEGSRAVAIDAAHDAAAVLHQLALELAGLPFNAKKRLLDDAVTALARQIDDIGAKASRRGQSGRAEPAEPAEPAAPPTPPTPDTPSDHDLLGCLARLLAAHILTLDEFETMRSRLEPRSR
jgi:hypothetical protein